MMDILVGWLGLMAENVSIFGCTTARMDGYMGNSGSQDGRIGFLSVSDHISL